MRNSTIGTTAERWLYFATLAAACAAGCGAADPGEVGLAVAECRVVPKASGSFETPGGFGSVASGTLAGWNPDGRWFVTGINFAWRTSSLHFERQGERVTIDRNDNRVAAWSDDALFYREEYFGGDVSIATLISNRVADGSSLRVQQAACFIDECTLCTGNLIYATYPDGEGVSDSLEKTSEFFGADWDASIALNVRMAGTLAYLIRRDGLFIIETADPAAPVEVGRWQRGADARRNDVKLVDGPNRTRFALIANSPVEVVDVTDPAAPVLVTQIAEAAHTLFTEVRGGKTYAYFGNTDGTCPVYDVSDPRAPQRLGEFAVTDSDAELVHDLSVVNGVAYLSAWDAGLLVVDFTDPTTPVLLGQWAETPARTSHSNWTTAAGGRKIAVHGDEAWGAHLDVVDIDPASATYMQPFGSYKTRDWVSIHNVMAFDDKAYITYYQDGVRVLDLSDPAQPKLAGYYNTWDPQAATSSSTFFEGAIGIDVDLSRKLIFVADTLRGLIILRDKTQ